MLKIRNRAESTAVPKLPLTWSASASMPISASDASATQAPASTPGTMPEPNANARTPQASSQPSEPTASDAIRDRAATLPPTLLPPPAAAALLPQAAGHVVIATDSAQPPAGNQLVAAQNQHDMAGDADSTTAVNGIALSSSPAALTNGCPSTGDELTPTDNASASQLSSTAPARAAGLAPANTAMPAAAPGLAAAAATTAMTAPPGAQPSSSASDNTAPDDAPSAHSAVTAAITPAPQNQARPAAAASTTELQPTRNLAAASSSSSSSSLPARHATTQPAPTASRPPEPPLQRQRLPAPPLPPRPQTAPTAPAKGKSPAKSAPASGASVYTITGATDTVGMQLLQLRANAHLTVEELVKRHRVSGDFIANLEKGNYAKLPAYYTCQLEIERLCFEYDIDPEPIKELFEQEYRASGRETSSVLPAAANRANSATGRNVFAPMGLATEEEGAHSLYSLPGLLIGILVVAILVLVASAFFYQQSQRNKPTTTLSLPKMDIAQHIKPRRPPLDLLQIPAN